MKTFFVDSFTDEPFKGNPAGVCLPIEEIGRGKMLQIVKERGFSDEDPVTGGVQTFLTKYWSIKLDKMKFRAYQSYERTGFMTTELLGTTVLVSGKAVIMMEGELNV